jgi:hypothetical protein
MREKPGPVLPPPLLAALAALGDGLTRSPAKRALKTVLVGLSALPVSAAIRASGTISGHMRFGWQPRLTLLSRLWSQLRFGRSRHSETDLLTANPDYAWLFIFHYNGYIREAALNAIPGPPMSPFFFAALAWRLNDWVPQVRQSAKRCADRVFPETEAAVAATAALHLLGPSLAWGRWGDEQQALHHVFGRADVVAVLARDLRQGTTGKLALCLRQALRYPNIDQHLARLRTEAVQPAVRAVALQTLISGKATWPQGLTWAWIDKVYGLKRQIIAYGSREIRRAVPPAQLIVEGIHDRSPLVRWVAAGALMEVQDELPDAEALIATLVHDKSPALRARADFMRRRQTR